MKKELSYPRTCPACGQRSVEPTTIRHVGEIRHESRILSVEIPDRKVGKCACGGILFDLETDVQSDTSIDTGEVTGPRPAAG
jgi:hypothetical protein